MASFSPRPAQPAVFAVLLGSLILLGSSLSGCAVGSSGLDGRGGPATELPAVPSKVAPSPTPAPTPAPTAGASHTVTPAPPATDASAAPSATPTQPAGTVKIGWDTGTTQINLSYTASQCFVSEDYILVEGSGTRLDTGTHSRVSIFTTPAELLHEKTGTYQANGIISFTVDESEIVADGRQIHIGDYPQPASFTYRLTDDSAKYVASLFEGAHDAGGGAIEVSCNY